MTFEASNINPKSKYCYWKKAPKFKRSKFKSRESQVSFPGKLIQQLHAFFLTKRTCKKMPAHLRFKITKSLVIAEQA
jgi:hypothetical protein